MKLNNDSRVILVSSVGAVLEFYDFIVYLLLSPIIAELFFHDTKYALLATYAIFAIGYFFRPVGGIILAHFGDKFGRKSAFLFTIFLMTFSTFFMASLPTSGLLWGTAPILLLIFRICQGLAVGGEIPGSITFAFEHLPKEKRFTGCALIFTGTSSGILLATVIVALFTNFLSHSEMLVWGWRPPFFLGAIIGALGIYIRYSLSDTPAFLEMEKKGKLLKTPVVTLFKKHKAEIILCFFLMLGSGALYSTICLLLSTILHTEFSYSLPLSYNLSIYLLIVFIIFTLLGPWLIGKLKKARILTVVFAAVILAAYAIPAFYTFKTHSLSLIIFTMTVLAITYGIICGTSAFIMASCFPPEVRFSGISVSYNTALAVGGGLTPITITVLMQHLNSLYAIPCFIISASVLCIISLLVLVIRNKHGKSHYM